MKRCGETWFGARIHWSPRRSPDDGGRKVGFGENDPPNGTRAVHFPVSPFFGHKSASDVQLPLSRRSSRRFWVRRSADAGLRYHQELTSLDEQALHRIARAAGRSL